MVSSMLPTKLRKMTPKLLAVFWVVGIAPLLIGSYLAFNKSSDALDEASSLAEQALRSQASERMETISALKKERIESYFKTINSQILNFSENPEVVRALVLSQRSYQSFRDSRSYTDADMARMTKELKAFYEGAFRDHYQKLNSGKPVSVDTIFKSLDPEAIALQHLYIADNPNPMEPNKNWQIQKYSLLMKSYTRVSMIYFSTTLSASVITMLF